MSFIFYGDYSEITFDFEVYLKGKGESKMTKITDFGPTPFVTNIETAAIENENYLVAL